MIKPRQNLVHAARQLARGQGGPVDHDDRQMKRPRSTQLGRSARAASILGDDMGDRMIPHHGCIARHIKGTARDDRAGLWQRHGSGIDKAQQVVMLWPAGESGKVLFADSQKHAGGLVGQGIHCRCDIGHASPVITALRLPCRTLQCDQCGVGQAAGLHGVAAHFCGERVGGVDDMGDGLVTQIVRQALDPAKAADPRGQGLRQGRIGAPRIGKYCIRAGVSQTLRQGAGLGRAAKQKDACHV